jgi:hypothetical protein
MKYIRLAAPDSKKRMRPPALANRNQAFLVVPEAILSTEQAKGAIAGAVSATGILRPGRKR